MDERWREVDHGLWEGLTHKEVVERHGEQARQRFGNFWDSRAHGGESGANLWMRVESAWEDLLRRYAGGRILVVTHGTPIRLLLCSFTGVPFEQHWKFRIDLGGVTALDVYPSATILRSVNEVPHLERNLSMTLEDTISRMPPLDRKAMEAAEVRQSHLTKPAGALGRLEELSVRLAGITGEARPRFVHRALVVAAASHGVAEEGVSAYPASVTAQMLQNILAGGAAINVLADAAGARLVVVDAGVNPEPEQHPDLRNVRLASGTRSFYREPAMPREHARTMIEAGIELVEELADGETTHGETALLGLGDMGIGNTTTAAAVVKTLTGAPVEEVTGRGTMVGDKVLEHKRAVISGALERHRSDPTDALGVLGAVGGYEIGFLAGCCLGAAIRSHPGRVGWIPGCFGGAAGRPAGPGRAQFYVRRPPLRRAGTGRGAETSRLGTSTRPRDAAR